jgi:hypothetical protein
MSQIWWFLAVAIALLAAALFVAKPWRRRVRTARLVQAKRRFHTQRERLEAKFIQLAAAHVKPDGPRWADCTFADDVAYVRNRTTGEVSAFVAMTVATEALHRLPPGTTDLVGNLQAGTAVFRLDHDAWVTDGRAILNLSPNEAIHYYRDDLEIVGEELAQRQ